MQEHNEDLCRRKLETAIDALMVIISSGNGLLRQTARKALVSIGGAAVPSLTKTLRDGNENARWVAAKALGEIGDPDTAENLVEALEDEVFSIRWLASEGLIGLEYDSLRPLLQALARKTDSVWLRESAHHVLRTLDQKGFHQLIGGLLISLNKGEEPGIVLAKTEQALKRLDEEDQMRENAEISLQERYRTRSL